MSWLFHFWRNLVHRDRVERDLDDEVRAAFDLLVNEKIHAGVDPQEARRASRLELGGIESVKEQVRDARSGAFLETFLQDIGYAVRLLRRNPLFTLTATLSLAIGIAATTTVFTVTNGLLLRSAIGVSDPDRLIDIVRLERGDPGFDPISYPDYLEVRRQATTVDGVYAYQLELEAVSLRVAASAERIFATFVTANYFHVLGVPAAAGRLFGTGDSEEPHASPFVVLSHRFWTRRFNSDSGIIGQMVHLNGQPFIVVGVAREGFRGTSVLAPDVWVPAAMVPAVKPERGMAGLTTRAPWLMVGARLKVGVSRAQASAEMEAIGAALTREFPPPPQFLPSGRREVSFVWSAETASPVPAGLRTVAATFLTLLMAIVSLVLIIACANLAGILLARATVRRREIAVRTAIGAARARIVRQLLTETIVLFILGCATGLVLARVVTSLLPSLLPAFPMPVNLPLPMDGRVVAFSVGLSLVAALLSGLAPALHGSKADVVSALKDEAQGPSDRLRLRNAFVVAQVAFSALLVVTAGVFVRDLERISSFDRGFDARNVDVASVELSMGGYTEATGPQFAHELIERVRTLSGVESASLADRTPGRGLRGLAGVLVPGVEPPNGLPFFYPNWMLVDSGYFATLRIPLVAGRDFSSADRAGTEPVAIVGEGTARRFWSGKQAVGQFLLVQTGNANAAAPVRIRVVGVARDLNYNARRGNALPFDLYVPFQQQYERTVTILARRAGERSVAGDLRALVASMDPNLPVLIAQPLENELTGPAETQLRIGAALAGTVGVIGLLLAALGIYGVTAYAVTQKTREIGIRLSLGARRSHVIAMVVRQGITLVTIGLAIGLVLAAGALRLLSGSPLAVTPPDAAIFACATMVFAFIGLVACYVPVLRATRIRAMDALRYE